MSQFPDVPVTDLPDDAVVLDIREQEEWDRGHAPTAVHIPMSELPMRVDELVPFLDRDEPLVITCRRVAGCSGSCPGWPSRATRWRT